MSPWDFDMEHEAFRNHFLPKIFTLYLHRFSSRAYNERGAANKSGPWDGEVGREREREREREMEREVERGMEIGKGIYHSILAHM